MPGSKLRNGEQSVLSEQSGSDKPTFEAIHAGDTISRALKRNRVGTQESGILEVRRRPPSTMPVILLQESWDGPFLLHALLWGPSRARTPKYGPPGGLSPSTWHLSGEGIRP